MLNLLSPISSESLKDVFVKQFEDLILSGKLHIGQRLSSERELALELGVSRPVVHEGLVELAARGLLTIKPRSGAVINDYRRNGSLSILSSIISYGNGRLEPALLNSLLQMRMHLETEFARLAALNRTAEQISDFKNHIDLETSLSRSSIHDVVEADFDFHHLVAMATGNLVYPLIINSFKAPYTNFTKQFFSYDKSMIDVVFNFHRLLAEAIISGDTEKSELIMKNMLSHGEKNLNDFLKK